MRGLFIYLFHGAFGEEASFSPLPKLRNIACGLTGSCVDLRTIGRRIGGPILRGFEGSGLYALQKGVGDVLVRGHETFLGPAVITDSLINTVEMEPWVGIVEGIVTSAESPFALLTYGSELNEGIKSLAEDLVFEKADVLAPVPEVMESNVY